MVIFSTNVTATGTWYLVTQSGDFSVGQQVTDTLGGGTLYIDIGNANKVQMADDADRTFTALMPPKLLTLAAGQYIRGRLTGATAPDVNVTAESLESPGFGLVESP